MFFSHFIVAITLLGEERANLSAFRTFLRFALVWFCLFPLPLGVWEGLRFVIVALPGLFSYLFFHHIKLAPANPRTAGAYNSAKRQLEFYLKNVYQFYKGEQDTVYEFAGEKSGKRKTPPARGQRSR